MSVPLIAPKTVIVDPLDNTRQVVVNADGSINATIVAPASTGQEVDLVAVAGAAVAQGNGLAATALRVALPTDGTGVVGLIAGSAAIGTVGPTLVAGLAGLTRVQVNINTAVTTALVTATAAQVIRVYRAFFFITAADSLTFASAASALLGGALAFPGVGTITWDLTGIPWLTCGTNEALNLTTTTTAQISGFVDYIKA